MTLKPIPVPKPGQTDGGMFPPGWADEPRQVQMPMPVLPPLLSEPAGMPEPVLPPSLLAPEAASEGPIRHSAPEEVLEEELGDAPAIPGTILALTGGLAVLVLGGLGLGNLLFVQGLFETSPVLGWLGAGISIAGWGLAAGAGLTEWLSLRRLKRVEGMAETLRRLPDAAPPPPELLRWIESLGARLPEAQPAIDAMMGADRMGSLRGLWQAALRPLLDQAVTQLGRQAGKQAFLGTAIAPSPSLDGLVVLGIGLRLLRQVARLHGLRPGVLASFALLRHLLLSAGMTAGVELAAETAFAQALQGRAAGLAGGAAGSVTAALRMPRLAAAAGKACRPLG